MFTIHLNKLEFFAHHGVHDEEAITGTDFEVNVSVNFNAPERIQSLDETINYVKVYEVIQKVFQQPVRLLESLAVDLTEAIYELDHRITTINISINKLNPPIGSFTGNVGVSFSKSF